MERATRTPLRRILEVLAVIISCSAPPAHGSLISSREVLIWGQHCCWSNSMFVEHNVGSGDLVANTGFWEASASISGTTDYGSITGDARSRAVRAGGFVVSSSMAHLRDAWSDHFTFQSASLPADTPIEVRITVSMTGSLFASGGGGGSGRPTADARLLAAAHFGGWDAPWITGVDVRRGTSGGAGGWSGTVESSVVLSASIGGQWFLVGDAVVESSSSNYPAWDEAFALGTATWYVDVLTSGAGYSTASGHSYATPVIASPIPEPGTCAMMLAGLGVLGFAARRRRPRSG